MADPVLVAVIVVGLGAAAFTVLVAWREHEALAGDWRWLKHWLRDRLRPAHPEGATEEWSPLQDYADTVIAPSPLLAAAASTWDSSRARVAAEIAALKARLRAIRTPTQAMFVQALQTAGETVPDTFGPREWWTIGDRRQDKPAPARPLRPTPQPPTRPMRVYQPALFEDVTT